MPRKRFSETQVIETLALQGAILPCYRCGKYLTIGGGGIEREHVVELALGGADTPVNCAYSHRECHARVTNGTKATTAGSSKQRIAKVRRILADKPSKRPMKSRGFDKTRTRTFKGQVVPRGA